MWCYNLPNPTSCGALVHSKASSSWPTWRSNVVSTTRMHAVPSYSVCPLWACDLPLFTANEKKFSVICLGLCCLTSELQWLCDVRDTALCNQHPHRWASSWPALTHCCALKSKLRARWQKDCIEISECAAGSTDKFFCPSKFSCNKLCAHKLITTEF